MCWKGNFFRFRQEILFFFSFFMLIEMCFYFSSISFSCVFSINKVHSPGSVTGLINAHYFQSLTLTLSSLISFSFHNSFFLHPSSSLLSFVSFFLHSFYLHSIYLPSVSLSCYWCIQWISIYDDSIIAWWEKAIELFLLGWC